MALAALDAMKKVEKIELSFSDLRDVAGIDVETPEGLAALEAWAKDNSRKLSVSSLLKLVSLSSKG